MSTEVVMPQMGESIAEGTITKWLKKVGERVERDEPLFEISTDKVDAEIPAPSAGVLTEIRAQEGETVAVNAVVAILNGESAQSAAPSVEAPAPGVVEASQPAAPSAAVVASLSPPAAAPAAPVAPSAPESGATPPPLGSTAAATSVASPISATPSGATAAASASQTAAPPSAPTAPSVAAVQDENGESASADELRRTRSSPLVRKIAEEHHIDLSQIEGTGMNGRVTKNDILSFIESGAAAATATASQPTPAVPPAPPAPGVTAAPSQAPAVTAPPATFAPPSTLPAPVVQAPPVTRPAQGDRVEPMSVMRRKIAEHMVLSRRTSAHVTTVYDIDMTRVARLRETNKDAFFERHGTRLTFMPFIFQAVTNAIRQYPIFNAQVAGDQILYKRDINLGMAVSLDNGLIVPVIKRADELSIAGLARTANDLADRARTKQLKPDEVAGGTFTVTNPGVFGGLFGTPIINQPQVAILATGAIEKRPKVLTSPEGEDYLAIRSMAYFALSYDHRIIDGADAEKFLAYIKELLEAGNFTV